jgi:type I restriction enzyme R subunit
MTGNKVGSSSKVVITTIQRLYSILRGEELDEDAEEGSQFDLHAEPLARPAEVAYNPALPPEFFDVIFIDECHRSIYTLWRQVLDYFDAHLIGLTATPAKHTFGFFNQNLVMEYDHDKAVADGVNVDHDIYRIRTQITEHGATIEAAPGTVLGRRERQTRAMRWQQADEDVTYTAAQLDRDVVAKDQIRKIVQTFRDRLFTEIFPGRTHVPKTLVFAKDDSHAEDIVDIMREEFGRGNEFCRKITYKVTGARPKDLIQEFRTSYNPRIAVTVDMIATGTDVRPIEIVMFMRTIKSRVLYDQMKGRGVRIVNHDELERCHARCRRQDPLCPDRLRGRDRIEDAGHAASRQEAERIPQEDPRARRPRRHGPGPAVVSREPADTPRQAVRTGRTAAYRGCVRRRTDPGHHASARRGIGP